MKMKKDVMLNEVPARPGKHLGRVVGFSPLTSTQIPPWPNPSFGSDRHYVRNDKIGNFEMIWRVGRFL